MKRVRACVSAPVQVRARFVSSRSPITLVLHGESYSACLCLRHPSCSWVLCVKSPIHHADAGDISGIRAWIRLLYSDVHLARGLWGVVSVLPALFGSFVSCLCLSGTEELAESLN